ncbi:MAG: STE24 endopeptidase [Thermoproteota archaeon]|jgi:STE24 endopeptidase
MEVKIGFEQQIFRNIFFLLFFLKLVFQLYLSFRNRRHIKQNSHAVPKRFEDVITLKDHKTAADYTVEKSNFASLNLLIDSAILLLWIPTGWLNQLDLWAISLGNGQIVTGLIFYACFSIISFLTSLPSTLYHTFILEEKYGFNKTTLKLFVSDLVKSTLLGILIIAPLIYGLLFIMEKLGSYWWFFAWIFITAFQFIIMWAYPTFIAPLFNKFKEIDNEEIKERIIKLAKKVDFSHNGIYVMDASKRSGHGNAYFTGFGKNKRIVFFDTLLETLKPEEVESVLAHELGHFKKKHIVKMMMRSLVFSLVGLWLLGQCYSNKQFYQALFIDTQSHYMGIFLFSLVTPVFTFFLTPLQAYLSRKNEFEADEFAAQNASGQSLISALVSMYKENSSTLTPDPLFSKFYHSHPPALERVKYLDSLN